MSNASCPWGVHLAIYASRVANADNRRLDTRAACGETQFRMPVMELTSVFVAREEGRKERRGMAEIHSIKDVFRDPLIITLVLVGIAGVLAGAVGSVRSHYQNTQEARATNQPSADDKPQSTQSDTQAPAITEPSIEAPATGETTEPAAPAAPAAEEPAAPEAPAAEEPAAPAAPPPAEEPAAETPAAPEAAPPAETPPAAEAEPAPSEPSMGEPPSPSQPQPVYPDGPPPTP